MKLTPATFRKWMKKEGLTIQQAGAVFGYKVQVENRGCMTISRILNGTWAGWSNPHKIMMLEMLMKKYSESKK